ncbi:hypothetical protein OHB24_27175 [Kribbella sp. NBC_00482]|uniref:hypothetical protein n=1 Tax=Kribbella sp. NBC_00482 TaxID=2975968 RepID=UPI002E191A40
MKLFRRRTACAHPQVSLTASMDGRTAVVTCMDPDCIWRAVAALPAYRPPSLDTGTARLIDSHALEELRLGAMVEQVFTRWWER